jgi:hypothetical protein
MLKNRIALSWIVLLPLFSIAQDTTHTSLLKKIGVGVYNKIKKEQYGKNVFKYNPTPTLLLSDSRNTALGYERTTFRNQSASVNFGLFYLDKLITKDIGAVNVTSVKNQGYILGVDYRFYLKKLNTRPAPNGIYIGPFYSLYFYNGGTRFDYEGEVVNGVKTSFTAEFSSKMQLHNFGLQLGYQFIFFKRISVDLILMGPAISYYNINLEIESNLNSEEKQEFYEKYYDKFFSKYPIFDQLFNIGNFNKSNVERGLFANYRYFVQFGYHF